MINYPVSFFGESLSTSGIASPWKVKSSHFNSTCSIPKEFEGPGSDLSPEDYFLLALQNCFVATFKVFAKYSALEFEELLVHAELVVDKDSDAKPFMKLLNLKIDLKNASDLKKATLLVKKTLENGFILRSVKTQITTEVNITVYQS